MPTTSSSSTTTLCGDKTTLPPTFNIPWVIATSLCVWFLFIHAPIAISSADFFKPRLFWIHMVGVSSIYLVCAHNTLLTPSTLGGRSKPFHVWAGRIGLLLGVGRREVGRGGDIGAHVHILIPGRRHWP